MKQLFGALDVDQLTDGLDQENLTGYFRAAKGKLYTKRRKAQPSQDDYAEYTLENGVMKWTGGSSTLISDFGDIGGVGLLSVGQAVTVSPCGPDRGLQ